MGSKRGRLLMRQHRVKKESEMSHLEVENEPKLERQRSEPTPNLLSVPQHSYLIKQNSSPHLSTPQPKTVLKEIEKKDDKTQQCINPNEICESSRSCHCPVLRPGPALGCNFCWNTIDGHGRILRRKTKYHCPECMTNLCIVPCFQEYHERHPSCNKESSTSNRSNQQNQQTVVQNPGTVTIMKTFSL